MKKVRNLIIVLAGLLISLNGFSQISWENVIGDYNVAFEVTNVDLERIHMGFYDNSSQYVKSFHTVNFNKLVSVNSIVFKQADIEGGQIWTQPDAIEAVYEGAEFEFITLDGTTHSITASDFISGTYTTQIQNVTGLYFKYDVSNMGSGSYASNALNPINFQWSVDLSLVDFISQSTVDTLNEQITQLEEDTATLNGQITTLNNQITSLNDEITQLEEDTATLNGQIIVLNQLLNDTVNYFTDTAYTNQFYNEGYTDGYADGYQAGSDQTSIIPPVNSSNDEVNVYPNPVKSNQTLYIQSDDLDKVEVYTSTGMKVMTDFINQLDISDLTTGMYIVKVYDRNDKVSVSRFMVSE